MRDETMIALVETSSIPEPNSGCWLWEKHVNFDGYGDLSLNKRKLLAHRVSYAAYNGAIARGAVVRHQCDNRTCVNPGHLVAGSHADNVADRVRRNRGVFGSRQHKAKLTDEIVREIKSRIANGETVTSLAKIYGVVQASISHIKIGRTWRHVT